MSVSGNAFSVGLLKRIISFTKPYKAQLLAAIGLTIFLALISPIRPLLVQYTLDHFIIIPDAKMLLTMTMLMIGVLLIETIGNFSKLYCITDDRQFQWEEPGGCDCIHNFHLRIKEGEGQIVESDM